MVLELYSNVFHIVAGLNRLQPQSQDDTRRALYINTEQNIVFCNLCNLCFRGGKVYQHLRCHDHILNLKNAGLNVETPHVSVYYIV